MSDTQKEWTHVKNLFALIIGIDEYKHATHLKGAVRDADMTESFLRNHLNVPDSRIINLRNEGATRKAISDAFCALCQSRSIGRGDPILIYFAGYGCELQPPDGWGAGALEKTRGLFPHDVQPRMAADRTIFPIPERTVISWLDKLSSEKGDNITIIFDACCSSGTSDEGARFQEFQGMIPSDIDNLTDGTHHEVMRPESQGQHPRSYVLLTACGVTEVAREVDGHGLFTKALLSTLQIPGVSKLSFTKFMKALPSLPRQKPRLIGQFKDRQLFTTKLQEERLHVFSVFPRTDKRYTIKAGKAHGITVGSVFEVYEDASIEAQSPNVSGTLRVKEVDSFEAIAILESGGTMETCTLPKLAHARLVHVGPENALRVHFSSAILDMIDLFDLLNDNVVAVEESSADLIVDLEDMNATFFTNLESVTKHGFRKLPYAVAAHPEAISEVLLPASRWKSHFNQRSYEHWKKDIHLEFVHLERDGNKVDDMGYIVLKRSDAKNLIINNVADIVINPEEIDDFYGVEIRNESDKNLYVYLFTFDISDFSIASRWMSDASQDPPLLAGCSLTVGYGERGGLPLCYELPRGVDIDVGFLKVYLTTQPIDLECLEQESPFSIFRSLSSSADVQMLEAEDQWGTIVCTIAQHAHPWGPDARFEQTVPDESSD